jgi:hypothetical protein
MREFCYRCQKTTEAKPERKVDVTNWRCVECDWIVDQDFIDDDAYMPLDPGDYCPTCGGEGVAEYNDCPEAWGEDCPSEANHLITCPNCGGSGRAKDCEVL